MRQILIGGLLATLAAVSTASAQNTLVAIDAPGQNSVVRQPFLLGGWAVDWWSTVGPGVSVVHVWAYPNPGSGEPPVFVGALATGPIRNDVGDLFGNQFRNSAFGTMVKGLPPKPYQFQLFPWSTVSNGFTAATILNLRS